ncbi:MAG: Lipopolysaccharide export system permease protein LptG [Candidatus Celerinatantimonas neptuna]|nr:MAG: Lipopolysaccharide export system permease protein LptG [Candidatus Celerinatantimonas neptuna]
MFRIIDWYVGRTIITTTMLVLVTLQGLSSIIKFVDQLGDVGKGNYHMLDALWYVILTIPKELELFFPMAALLGALIGLGNLATSSELVIMQSVGLSKGNIANAVIKTAVPMMIIMMLLGEFVAPKAELMAKSMRSAKKSGGAMISVQNGVWAKDKSSFVNIGQVRNGKHLRRITVYYFDQNQNLYQILTAPRANYQNGSWLMQNAVMTLFSDDKIQQKRLAGYHWYSALTPEKLGVVVVKPLNLPISGLYSYINYLRQNKQDPAPYQLAMWRKIMMPFTVVIMMLLALSYIFGPLRSVSMGARLIMGIITGFSFYVLNQVLASLSLVYKMPPIIGAIGPSLMFFALAVYMINRRR